MTYYELTTGYEVSDDRAHELFDEYLDDVLDEVAIGTLTYSPSRALKALDPIAYRCEFSDWVSEQDHGLVESGYWVRVITVDGEEVPDFTEWFTDEDDARQAAADFAQVGMDDAPAGEYFVQCYDTSDDILSELRVIVR